VTTQQASGGVSSSRDAREAALQAFDLQPEPVAGVVGYGSRGTLFIAGPQAAVRAAAEALAELPHCTVLVTDAATDDDGWQPPQAESRNYRGTLISITGHLGRYEVEVEAGGQVGNPRVIDKQRYFDVVLDLTATPAITAERLPPGYFAPSDAASLSAALEEIRGLQGEFEKPVYIRYAEDICARGTSGLTGCTRCAEVCPAWALTAGAESISIDTHLCQGIGPCATVCPSGAIGYAYPERAELLAGLGRGIAAYREVGGEPPALLFHGREWGESEPDGWRDRLPATVLPIEIEEVGAVGSEIWLAALAFGATQVCLLTDASLPDTVRGVLDGELGWVHAALTGLGESPQRVALVDDPTAGEWLIDAPVREPARFATDQDKRTTLFMALDHLWHATGQPTEPVPLPVGAPLGNLAINVAACTLCLSCVSVCPLKALHDGGDTPRLAFVEQNCVQCGLCVTACPEKALALQPRLLLDSESRRTQRVLKEEEPFCCITCGKPFATPSVIERMTEKLKDHPMFQGGKLDMLKMCEECRVSSMFTDDNTAPGPGMRVN